jgi:hypothetical protein
MLMRRLFLLPLLTIIALGVLGACGDDDDDNGDGTATATTTGTAGTPGATSTATTPAGSPTTPGSTASPTEDSIPFETPSTVFTKDAGDAEQAILADIRTGRNPTWDRVVIEFEEGEVPGYEVRYVDEINQCGSGEPVEFESPVIVSVTVRPAVGHTEDGEATVPNVVPLDGTISVKEVLGFCDFEGVVGYGIGLTGVRPFRVFELDGPPRLVIDFSG